MIWPLTVLRTERVLDGGEGVLRHVEDAAPVHHRADAGEYLLHEEGAGLVVRRDDYDVLVVVLCQRGVVVRRRQRASRCARRADSRGGHSSTSTTTTSSSSRPGANEIPSVLFDSIFLAKATAII